MATIEERAEKIVRTANSVWFCPSDIEECVIQQEITLAIKVATEQDSIARKEERERCIDIIGKKVCGWCLVDDADCYKTSCMAKELRDAIKEGGNK